MKLILYIIKQNNKTKISTDCAILFFINLFSWYFSGELFLYYITEYRMISEYCMISEHSIILKISMISECR